MLATNKPPPSGSISSLNGKNDFCSSAYLILFYNTAKFTALLHSETANDTIPLPYLQYYRTLIFRDELSKMLATVSSLNKRNELRVT